MGLRDAKEELQWGVVTEALRAADVDADTMNMVEQARNSYRVFHSLGSMLIGSADQKQAKNYVKVEMHGLISPFERVYVELVRPDGKTSHELREMLRGGFVRVRNLLARGTESTSQVIEEIDEMLASEAP